MADTIRSLAELNALFADNGIGSITPQDIRDLMVSMMVHGEIGSLNKAAVTLPAGFTPLDFNAAGAVGRGLTIDTANKWIVSVPVAIKAEVSLEANFNGSNNTTFDFAVFRNPDGTAEQLTRLSGSCRIVSAAMIGSVSLSAAIQLQPGDKLQAGVRANGASFTLLRGGLRVRRIGIE